MNSRASFLNQEYRVLIKFLTTKGFLIPGGEGGGAGGGGAVTGSGVIAGGVTSVDFCPLMSCTKSE